MKTLDGSAGEGGGQILRTALFLSILRQEPLRIERIRAGRPKAGLKAQHVAILRLLASITGAETEGVRIGAPALEFRPAAPKPGRYAFDVGTAGSIPLILQTLLPVCLIGPGRIELDLEGGTDVWGGPTIDWVRRVYIPWIQPLARRIDVEVVRRGFAPEGGGRVRVLVEAGHEAVVTEPHMRRFVEAKLGAPRDAQGRIVAVEGTSVAEVRLLERHVADRQAKGAGIPFDPDVFPAPKVRIEHATARGIGSSVTLWIEDDQGNRLGADELGRRGKLAEDVGRSAAVRLLEDWRSGATVDRHLADHLVPWVALGAGPVRVPKPTPHLETNVETCRHVLGVDTVHLEGRVLAPGPFVRPSSHKLQNPANRA